MNIDKRADRVHASLDESLRYILRESITKTERDELLTCRGQLDTALEAVKDPHISMESVILLSESIAARLRQLAETIQTRKLEEMWKQ